MSTKLSSQKKFLKNYKTIFPRRKFRFQLTWLPTFHGSYDRKNVVSTSVNWKNILLNS